MLSAVTIAIARVGTSLKMSASTSGIYLGGWSHRRWLVCVGICPKSGSNTWKPDVKNASPPATIVPGLVVNPS